MPRARRESAPFGVRKSVRLAQKQVAAPSADAQAHDKQASAQPQLNVISNEPICFDSQQDTHENAQNELLQTNNEIAEAQAGSVSASTDPSAEQQPNSGSLQDEADAQEKKITAERHRQFMELSMVLDQAFSSFDSNLQTSRASTQTSITASSAKPHKPDAPQPPKQSSSTTSKPTTRSKSTKQTRDQQRTDKPVELASHSLKPLKEPNNLAQPSSSTQKPAKSNIKHGISILDYMKSVRSNTASGSDTIPISDTNSALSSQSTVSVQSNNPSEAYGALENASPNSKKHDHQSDDQEDDGEVIDLSSFNPSYKTDKRPSPEKPSLPKLNRIDFKLSVSQQRHNPELLLRSVCKSNSVLSSAGSRRSVIFDQQSSSSQSRNTSLIASSQSSRLQINKPESPIVLDDDDDDDEPLTTTQNATSSLLQDPVYLSDDDDHEEMRMDALIRNHAARATLRFENASMDDDDDEDNRWSNNISRWNRAMNHAFMLEQEELKKAIELIPVDQKMEQSIDEHVQKLKLAYGGDGSPDRMAVKLMPHQIRGLAWLVRMEESEIKGGILADDMGMGKTIQILALIVHNYKPPTENRGGTLVVAPLSLITQWRDEVVSKTNANLKIYVYHGQDRTKSKYELRKFDIVITTYHILATESPTEAGAENGYINKPYKGGPLFRAKWHRVVLDESQAIKNRDTKASTACSRIDAYSRFSLSGTPIQNNVDEVYSQFRFLRIPHWERYDFFSESISSVIRRKIPENTKLAIQRLQAVLGSCLLRRTKSSNGPDGKPILELPERNVHIIEMDLTPPERAFYMALETRAVHEFQGYLDEGTVMRNYTNILVLLLRLRQAASHPHLVVEAFENAQNGEFNLDFMGNGSRGVPPKTPHRDTVSDHVNPNVFEGTTNMMAGVMSTHTARSASTNSQSQSVVRNKKAIEDPNSIEAELYRSDMDAEADVILHRARMRMKMDVLKRVLDAAHDDPSQFLSQECPLCCDVTNNPVITICGHVFCFECISGHLAYRADENSKGVLVKPCPVCRADVDSHSLFPVHGFVPRSAFEQQKNTQQPPVASQASSSRDPPTTASRSKNRDEPPLDVRKVLLDLHPDSDWTKWITSTKLEAMMDHLDRSLEETPHAKTILFSQWTRMLDLVEPGLRRRGIRFLRYDGTMSGGQRDQAIQEFKTNQDVSIMLVSLKCGGVGLNLTAASRVIMLDLWWNPAVEDQAIDRVHRIGQQYNVDVARIVAKDTVERRILELQQSKREVVAGVLGEGEFTLGRLSMQDLLFLFQVNR